MRESIRRQERRRKRHRNTSNMKNAITMSNRFNVGIEASVAICNARAVDMGIDLAQSPDLVVTESTFRKKRKTAMLELANTHKADVTSVYIGTGRAFVNLGSFTVIIQSK